MITYKPSFPLHSHPLDKDNPSLRSSPQSLKYSCGRGRSKAWSGFRFLGRDLKGRFKSYQLWIAFAFKGDDRNILRAERSNGWIRGHGFYLCNLDGSEINEEESKLNRRLLYSKLCSFLGKDSIKDYPVKRYHVTLLCYSMNGYALPKHNDNTIYHTHHKDGVYEGNALNDSKSNLEVLHRDEHYHEHSSLNDDGYFDYLIGDNLDKNSFENVNFKKYENQTVTRLQPTLHTFKYFLRIYQYLLAIRCRELLILEAFFESMEGFSPCFEPIYPLQTEGTLKPP